MSNAEHPTSPRTGYLLAGAMAGGLLALPLLINPPEGFASGQGKGLALVACALTLFVGLVVVAYSARYMRADRRRGAFFALVALLISCVAVFAITSNIVVMALAWAASGWTLARLVGHEASWAEAASAARRTAGTFLVGDVALVVAAIMLAGATGSLDIATILASAGKLATGVATCAALLLLLAAAVRCALPPFSGWLLSSMPAPTPVSALMHAGLVNAGGFLLIRFAPVLEAAPLARFGAIALGLAGAFYGLGIMLVRPDVKRSLAGSTVSQMGFMIISCGIGAYSAAAWHIVAHGLFKAWLFLGAGSNVGIKQPQANAAGEPRVALAVAAVALLAGMLLIVGGAGSATLVPLLLGAATAAATFIASVRAPGPLAARVSLAGGIAALVALHAGGLALTQWLVGHDGPALLPSWALMALLAAFLGAWVWQQQRLHRSGTLPLALYIHLLNAGSLKPAHPGEAR